jgi:hypothetical protein
MYQKQVKRPLVRLTIERGVKRLVVASINKQQIQDTAEMNAERNIADETPLTQDGNLNSSVQATA